MHASIYPLNYPSLYPSLSFFLLGFIQPSIHLAVHPFYTPSFIHSLIYSSIFHSFAFYLLIITHLLIRQTYSEDFLFLGTMLGNAGMHVTETKC